MATKKTTDTKKTTTTAKKKSPARTTGGRKKKITADDIRLRASQIYEERVNHGKHGDDVSDWLQAEKELSETK